MEAPTPTQESLNDWIDRWYYDGFSPEQRQHLRDAGEEMFKAGWLVAAGSDDVYAVMRDMVATRQAVIEAQREHIDRIDAELAYIKELLKTYQFLSGMK